MLINKFFWEKINMKKNYTSPERGPALLKTLPQFLKSAKGHQVEHLQMFSSTLSMLKSFTRAKSLGVEHVEELYTR